MKKYILLGVVAALSLAACTSEVIDVADFDIKTEKTTYKVGEPVVFTFVGNPDLISFYSGENGRRYEFRNRTQATGGKPTLSFQSFRQSGNQDNTIELLASTDFSGTYDSTNIRKATWTNLTGRAVLSTGADNTNSGAIDLSTVVAGNKPIYVAFRYNNPRNATAAQRTWTIKTVNLNNVLPDGSSYNLYNSATAGWVAVDVKNPANQWALSASQVQITGGAANAPDNEDWVIARPIDPMLVIPDVAVALKNITTYQASHSYTFTTAGTYTVTFVGANETSFGRKEVVRQVTLTITP